jgi:hypothetical protein
MIYLPGVTVTSGISISSNGAIPFSVIGRQAPVSAISLNTSNGIISIATTGFYQITIGVSPVSTTATVTSTFQIELGGASGGGVIQQTLEFVNLNSGFQSYSITTIVQISTNPTTMTVTNTSAARSLNNESGTTTGGPAAYITIIGLQ